MDRATIYPDFICSDIKCIETVPEPCGIIIFGASGDLTSRKLLPALYKLYKNKVLKKEFFILGSSRTEYDDEKFREDVEKSIQKFLPQVVFNKQTFKEFSKNLYYTKTEYNDLASYSKLYSLIESLSEKYKIKNIIFYLAIPPELFPDIINRLGIIFKQKKEFIRIVIEKPFGYDLKSAKELNKIIHENFDEKQIYRIDHYLGKETVQNILMFRFANSIFEPIWNRNYIDHVQISALETVGVEHRAGYYEKAGALRDMFQNHMLQLLSLVAMESPVEFDADSIHDEKSKLFRSIRHKLNESVILGQYDRGQIDGIEVPAYREEKGVSFDSNTETYAAVKFMIDNLRWKDVPFYLRAGKRLKKRVTEIAIEFKKIPHSFFSSILEEDFPSNVLVFNIQPDEGISLTFEAKRPGSKICIGQVKMDFSYKEVYKEELPDAYERLLLDVMLNDRMLFNREDAVEMSWALIAEIIDGQPEFSNYKSGSYGPEKSDKLIEKDNRKWRN